MDDGQTATLPPQGNIAHYTARITQSKARGIIEAMMRWHKDIDRNFVEQFQTTGFDARMWELYLFAALQEAGYRISPGVPDLQLEAIDGGLVFVEATTAGPPGQGADEPPTTDDTQLDPTYWTGYLPIRFAGPLVEKLKKRYWERPNVAGHPLVLAIQDFHAPMSMTWSRSALPMYLYGREYDAQHDSAGRLIIASERMHEHRWGSKALPSGFFDQAGAEHISAVTFNNGATISKFNRMGAIAGCADQAADARDRPLIAVLLTHPIWPKGAASDALGGAARRRPGVNHLASWTRKPWTHDQ